MADTKTVDGVSRFLHTETPGMMAVNDNYSDLAGMMAIKWTGKLQPVAYIQPVISGYAAYECSHTR